MLKEERQAQIISLIGRQGKVLAAELVSTLNVSEDTVRRDLSELAEAGVLQRVHGGAILSAPTRPYEQRLREVDEVKIAIAREAAQLIHHGQVVIMDSGTTVLEVALHLPLDLQATIITNSLPVATALLRYPGIDVHVLGGRLKKEAQAMVGIEVVEALKMFRADLCLLGVCSLHPEIGISTPDLEETAVKRTMIVQAAEVVAVTSATKLNTAAHFIIAPLNALTYLVTDNSIEEKVVQQYQHYGISVIKAGSGSPG